MKGFSGFPAKSKYTPIPNIFFSEILPQVNDLAELKVTLHIFWVLYQKRGYPRFVTYGELTADPVLMRGIEGQGSAPEVLRQALNQAVSRCTLLCLKLERDGEAHELYLINDDAGRKAAEKIESGELKVGNLAKAEPYQVRPEPPNIFTLYEQNIGMITSPTTADELKEAEKTYPPSWIQDAFKEAVDLNRRNWRYISRILERWAAEGKDDGKPGRHPKAESDPEEYYRRYKQFLKR
jgi:DnaD/phage-associated family protein